MMNEKDNKIFSSYIVVPSENEIWVIKKNSGSGKKEINDPFRKFFPSGYDNNTHNNISAKISKKISESSKSCNGLLVVTPSLFSPKKKMLNGWIKKDIPIKALTETISFENLPYISCNPWRIKKTLHAKKKEIREKLSRCITISSASIGTEINYGKFISYGRIKVSFWVIND